MFTLQDFTILKMLFAKSMTKVHTYTRMYTACLVTNKNKGQLIRKISEVSNLIQTKVVRFSTDTVVWTFSHCSKLLIKLQIQK